MREQQQQQPNGSMEEEEEEQKRREKRGKEVHTTHTAPLIVVIIPGPHSTVWSLGEEPARLPIGPVGHLVSERIQFM